MHRSKTASLFDHVVGTRHQRLRHGEAERLRGFLVDVQLDFSGLLHWQVGGLVALENPAGIVAGQAVCLRRVSSVAQQTSGHGKLTILVDRWHRVAERQRGELFAPAREERIAANHEPARSQLDQLCEDPIEVTFGAGIQDMKPARGYEPLPAAPSVVSAAVGLAGLTSRAMTLAVGTSSWSN